ncbi:MAG: hypothetical protein Q7R73_04590 [bacterium]|nr:hypothetical protein [bacterium]
MDHRSFVIGLTPWIFGVTLAFQGYLVWAGAVDMTRALWGWTPDTTKKTASAPQEACPIKERGL